MYVLLFHLKILFVSVVIFDFVFVSNTSWYIWNFRINLIKKLIKKNYSILVVAPTDTYSDLINFALGVSRNGSIDGISVNIDKGGALSTFRKDIKEVIGKEKIESIFVGSKVSAKNLDVFEFLDVIAIVTPVGLFLGRIANFINSELYGKATEVIWSVKFLKVDEIYRHPSQLYEAFLEGIVLFVILILIGLILQFCLDNSFPTTALIFIVRYSLFCVSDKILKSSTLFVGFITD